MIEVPPPPPERKPNYEVERPIHLKCHCCKKEMTTDFNNTAYFIYYKQPWFDHVRTVCDEGGVNIKMIDVKNQEEVEFANQFMPAEFDFCEDEPFIEFFKKERGVTDLEYKNLTMQQERMVEFMHWLLNTSDFIAEFGTPHNES